MKSSWAIGNISSPSSIITIEDVQNTIPCDRLLTYDVAEGWRPLCEFLDAGVPETAFPATNKTVEFQERTRERDRAAAAAKEN